MFKKLIQLERHLNNSCSKTNEGLDNILSTFLERDRLVWFWDFHPEEPVCIASFSNINDFINFKSAFLALSEKSGNTIYFNGDNGIWVCGAWNR